MSHIHKQGGKYSYAYIEALLVRVKIEEVIGDFVRLRRVNKEYAWGLCPFHGERSPSFTVCERGLFYHCYGCGHHGDVVRFLVHYFSRYHQLARFERKHRRDYLRQKKMPELERLRRRYAKSLLSQKEFGYLDAIRYLANKYHYWPSQHKRIQKRVKKI